LLKVGLTGGIASGKSAIGDLFVALGAHLIKADEIAHQLMQPGLPVYERVVQHFGPVVLNPDHSINRAKLAELAFGSERQVGIQELNKIVHPAVLEAQAAWMESVGRDDPGSIAMVEAALILEAGALPQFDRLVVVTCRPEQRVQRLAQRLDVSADVARREMNRRMAVQLPDEEKIKAADYVIDNSGPLESSRKRVAEIFADLQRQVVSLAEGPKAVQTKK
jgi:dephospho-CoA kinase